MDTQTIIIRAILEDLMGGFDIDRKQLAARAWKQFYARPESVLHRPQPQRVDWPAMVNDALAYAIEKQWLKLDIKTAAAKEFDKRAKKDADDTTRAGHWEVTYTPAPEVLVVLTKKGRTAYADILALDAAGQEPQTLEHLHGLMRRSGYTVPKELKAFEVALKRHGVSPRVSGGRGRGKVAKYDLDTVLKYLSSRT